MASQNEHDKKVAAAAVAAARREWEAHQDKSGQPASAKQTSSAPAPTIIYNGKQSIKSMKFTTKYIKKIFVLNFE